MKNGELLPEGKILQSERAASSERRPGCGKHGDQEREHVPIYQFRRRRANQTKRQRSRVDRILANDTVGVLGMPAVLSFDADGNPVSNAW